MKKYIFLLLLAIAFTACNKKEGQQANIIILLIDDAGYADFGFMGSEDLETPRIDQLASSGIIFTDAHVTATVCAPSRAGLITGRYQQRFGHECNGTGGDLGTDPNESTLADVLKSVGYKTIAMGKWHLGHTEEYLPNNRGFDEFYGFLGGSRSYFPLDNPRPHNVIRHNRNPVEFEGYLTDVLGDKAVEYIEECQNEPFFIYLSFNAVHTPMQAREDHLEKYKDHPRKELAAMTWSLDENIGKILDKLSELKILDNTLIFFLSDNGGSPFNQASCEPLKGWKGNKFEGGHRVAYSISWPDKILGAKKFNGLTSSLDIFATSIKAAGINDYQGLKLDGIDLLPYLTKDCNEDPHESLYWRKDKMAAARKGNYKLIRLDGYGSRLYNLADDLSESVDLQKEQTDKLSELTEELEKWESEMIDPLWVEAEAWQKVTYEIHQGLMENREPDYISPGQMKKFQNK